MTKKKPSNKKLKSLAMMAKRGFGNEKKLAIKILKHLCKKHDLDYKSVLSQLLIEEFSFGYKDKKMSKRLALQAIAKYAMLEGDTSYWSTRWDLTLKTTKEKWNDFLSAVDEVRRKYNKQRRQMLARQRKERNLFFRAFIQRHELFYPYPMESKKTKKKELTDKDLKEMRMWSRMAEEMGEDLSIHKQIEGK